MFRVIVGGLLARRLRLYATGLAVMLGVAFMAGTLVLTSTRVPHVQRSVGRGLQGN